MTTNMNLAVYGNGLAVLLTGVHSVMNFANYMMSYSWQSSSQKEMPVVLLTS